MDERPCIRGCVYRGRHVHTCAEASGAARLIHAIFGGDMSERCTGCEPVDAAHGALICDRDIRALRRTIEDAPDLCTHLRSRIDPSKSTWNFTQAKPTFDGPTTRRMPSSSRPPTDTDIVEAADEVLGILAYWAEYFGDEMDYRGRRSFPAGVDSAEAYFLANMPAQFLLEHLDEIVNDRLVRLMCEKVLGPTADPEDWTIAKVARQWSMWERPRWSPQPCPGCEKKTIQVRPPRRLGDDREFVCRNESCGWRVPAAERVQWMEYFGLGTVVVEEQERREPSEPAPAMLALVGASAPGRRVTGELNLDGLDRDSHRKVCEKCWLLMPCGCEGVAA